MSSREYPSRPVVAASILLHRRGRVLVLQRNRQPNKGAWALPGGVVELGEQVQEAALRELKEETGVGARIERLFDALDEVHLDDRGRVKNHFVIVNYLGVPTATNVHLNAESMSYGWFTPREVMKMNASKNTKLVVAKLEGLRKRRSPAARKDQTFQ